MFKSQKKICNSLLKDKTVLVRVDLNVPVIDGKVQDKTRIKSLVPSIIELIKKEAKVVICSHLGRPNGTINLKYSLKPLLKILSKELGIGVLFSTDCIGDEATKKKKNLKSGQVLLLENVRFHKGEEVNNKEFSASLASNCDLYINDAFSCSHRKHASIIGITNYLPSFSGLNLEQEIHALDSVLTNPKKPVVSIVGGSKVSTKIGIIKFLAVKMDYVIIGGAMANTFIAAMGYKVGKSLYEKNALNVAREIIEFTQNNDCKLILPNDVVVAKTLSTEAKPLNTNINNIPAEMMALDIGSNSINVIKKIISNSSTLLWNGPLGAFEIQPFDKGTSEIANFVAKKTKTKQLISVAGGGDTISALNNAGVTDNFSYVSTAGGAFLEWLEGKELPGILAMCK